MPKPAPNTYPIYFKQYIDQVIESDLSTAFSNQLPIIKDLLINITAKKSEQAYASAKWTLKELLQHIIDTERIFSYRALCFSRKEIVSLPGFDENIYAANSNANAREWLYLVEEFIAVRLSTECLFNSFSAEVMTFSGISNNNKITVNSIGFIILGHFNHHKKIIEERYLPN